MNRTIKWGLIVGGGLILLLIAALVLLPKFVDVKQYKPRIEAQVTKATGRSFSLGDDLRLSLFPYAIGRIPLGSRNATMPLPLIIATAA